jgi:hypothetical protein
LDSTPLLAPFYGTWQVYQGIDGEHTHRNRWRYALDFHQVEKGRSYTQDGSRLSDYLCFGRPVLSPAFGTVIRLRDDLPDNQPGSIDIKNNWGNYIVLQADSGVFVLLAHLMRGSIRVKRGERVTPETIVAACGSSGRSPQPHLHMQVQQHASLGSSTLPLHLVSSLIQRGDTPIQFQLVARPSEGSSVRRAVEDHQLAAAVQLPIGRTLSYSVTGADGVCHEEDLRVDVSLLGQMRLLAENGAAAAFENQNATLAFYDRQGKSNELLDLWCLALGLTPLSSDAARWEDAPPAKLLPMSLMQRSVVAVARPLGAGIDSRYEREWVEAEGVWKQMGDHQLHIANRVLRARTVAVLSPTAGCISLMLECCGKSMQADLTKFGQIADLGVPRWESAVDTENSNRANS